MHQSCPLWRHFVPRIHEHKNSWTQEDWLWLGLFFGGADLSLWLLVLMGKEVTAIPGVLELGLFVKKSLETLDLRLEVMWPFLAGRRGAFALWFNCQNILYSIFMYYTKSFVFVEQKNSFKFLVLSFELWNSLRWLLNGDFNHEAAVFDSWRQKGKRCHRVQIV